jgi:hypothetical protein
MHLYGAQLINVNVTVVTIVADYIEKSSPDAEISDNRL